MKAFAFLLMSMLLSFNSIAQNTKQFSGVVLDKGTGMQKFTIVKEVRLETFGN